MTTAAKKTFGTKVFIDPAPAAPTTPVGELLEAALPKGAREVMDVTTHDSPGGAEEYMPEGTYDPGQLEITGHYIARSPLDVALRLAFTSAALQNIKCQPKTATGTEDQTFSGFVIAYGPDAMPVKGKQTFTATIKVTGPVTSAVTE
jgi:hypothetical protein